MEININTETLKANKLGVAAYTALWLIWKDRHATVLEVCENVDFDVLEESGWMKRNGDTMEDWVVRGKFLGLVTTKDNMLWLELCAELPFKVPDGRGGYRMLRAKDPTAKSNDKPRKRYISIVKGKPELHALIVKCARAEVKAKRGQLQFLQNIDTWIFQRTWEKYEHTITEETDKPQDEGYGSKVI